MRVPHNRYQTLPAAEFPDRSEINSRHNEPTSERVAQNVRRNDGKISTGSGRIKGGSEALVRFPVLSTEAFALLLGHEHPGTWEVLIEACFKSLTASGNVGEGSLNSRGTAHDTLQRRRREGVAQAGDLDRDLRFADTATVTLDPARLRYRRGPRRELPWPARACVSTFMCLAIPLHDFRGSAYNLCKANAPIYSVVEWGAPWHQFLKDSLLYCWLWVFLRTRCPAVLH